VLINQPVRNRGGVAAATRIAFKKLLIRRV
jgi:hypothetical protein